MRDDWFNRGLPLNVEIHCLDCEAYDANFVRCVNCHKYGYVEIGINDCPSCKCTGCLMDIQESDIKESV